MKKLILLCLLFFSKCCINSASSQIVDSVSIQLNKDRHLEYGPWDYLTMESDSFSSELLKSSLRRKWEANSWINETFNSFTYSAGELTNSISQNQDSLLWVNVRKWTYVYSASADSTLSQLWNTSWENDTLKISYHNSSGLDSLLLSRRWQNSTWINLIKQENIFANDSTFLSNTFSSWDTLLSQWNFTRRYLWSKDSLGNDTAFIYQNYISGAWKNSRKTLSRYSGTLLVDQTVSGWSDFDSSFSDLELISTFTYDSLGRIVYGYYDGFPGGFSTDTYIYDSTGILVNLLFHNESQGGIVHETNKQWLFYTYPISNSIYLFSINDTIPICSNDSVRAGFFAIGGTLPLHFQWTPSSAVSNDTLENPYFIADSSSLLTVTITDSSGHSAMDSIFLKVNQPPSILSVQSIPACIGCNNGLFVMTVTPGSSPLYYYFVSPSVGVVIPGDSIKNLSAGVYTICLYDFNYCSVCITDTILEDNTVVSETNREAIRIFPNPNPGSFSIDLGESFRDAEIIVTNSIGQEVSRGNYYNTAKLNLEVIGERGLYFIRIVTGERISFYRVLKL